MSTNLDPYIIRHLFLLHQTAHEQEVCVAGRGVGDLDLLETALHEQPEKSRFLLDRHRIGESLITVPQIGREPDWRLGYNFGRPLTVLQIQGSVGSVLL